MYSTGFPSDQGWGKCVRVCALPMCSVAQPCLILCNPMTAVHHTPLSVRFSDKNTGVGCHFLLQGVFPTQESNVSWLSCIGRCILYHWATWEACVCVPLRTGISVLLGFLFIFPISCLLLRRSHWKSMGCRLQASKKSDPLEEFWRVRYCSESLWSYLKLGVGLWKSKPQLSSTKGHLEVWWE